MDKATNVQFDRLSFCPADIGNEIVRCSSARRKSFFPEDRKWRSGTITEVSPLTYCLLFFRLKTHAGVMVILCLCNSDFMGIKWQLHRHKIQAGWECFVMSCSIDE